MKILLVEDDFFFSQRVTEFLVDNGLEVVTVRSTQQALAENLSNYDGAIVDVMLPNDPDESGINAEEARGGYLAGVAVTRRFRQIRSDFPVILLSSDITSGEARQWARERGIPFVVKHEDRGRMLSAMAMLGLAVEVERPRSFIVHGHDEALLAETKDYLQNTLGWPIPIVLRDQPNAGKTIIEKFEEQAGIVDWVFVLLSPDDASFDAKTNEEKRRARQNVVLELGFFYGLLGRREGRVIVLKKGEVELPSDLSGVIWIDVSSGVKASGEDIRKEVGSAK